MFFFDFLSTQFLFIDKCGDGAALFATFVTAIFFLLGIIDE